MKEVGIDISAEFAKPWTDEVVRPIRDAIEAKVRGLLHDLDVPVAG